VRYERPHRVRTCTLAAMRLAACLWTAVATVVAGCQSSDSGLTEDADGSESTAREDDEGNGETTSLNDGTTGVADVGTTVGDDDTSASTGLDTGAASTSNGADADDTGTTGSATDDAGTTDTGTTDDEGTTDDAGTTDTGTTGDTGTTDGTGTTDDTGTTGDLGRCGDGIVDAGETCDIAIPNGDGACPTLADCDDGEACTTYGVADVGTCTATCTQEPITDPVPGDACCPDGETSLTDDDCEPVAQCDAGDVIVGNAFDPSTSLTATNDHEGAVWVLWVEDGGSFADIRGARLDPATDDWASDVPVETTSNDVLAVTAHLDHAGELWAVWAEAGAISDEVRGGRLDPVSGTWQADVPIGSTFDAMRAPAAAPDHTAALWALWVEDGDIADDVRAARLDPATDTWLADVPVGTTFDDALHLAAANDHQGALWALWAEAGGITDDIRAARLDPATGTWDADVPVGTSFDNVTDVALSVDDDDALWALWIENGGIAPEVRGARLDPTTSTWEPDVAIGVGFEPLHDLVATRDANGVLRVSWIEDGGVADSIRSAALDPDTGSWSADVEVGATFDDATNLVMGRGSDTATWAIWAEVNGIEAVRATRLDPATGVWAPDVLVQSSFDPALEVVAASDPGGELWAAWVRDGPFDGSQVRATSCGFF